MTDPISDMLTRLRNAIMAGHKQIELPGSKLKFALAKILETEGFLDNVHIVEVGPRKLLKAKFAVGDAGIPKIQAITRISKPGLRVYKKATDLRPVRSGFGIAIISTPNGLMTAKEARKRSLGGELICEVY